MSISRATSIRKARGKGTKGGGIPWGGGGGGGCQVVLFHGGPCSKSQRARWEGVKSHENHTNGIRVLGGRQGSKNRLGERTPRAGQRYTTRTIYRVDTKNKREKRGTGPSRIISQARLRAKKEVEKGKNGWQKAFFKENEDLDVFSCIQPVHRLTRDEEQGERGEGKKRRNNHQNYEPLMSRKQTHESWKEDEKGEGEANQGLNPLKQGN